MYVDVAMQIANVTRVVLMYCFVLNTSEYKFVNHRQTSTVCYFEAVT